MIIQKIFEQTVASKFKRMAYFHGQLLTEDDLQEEQNYLREKLKLHNRLHGKGVVEGLRVIVPFDPNSTECKDDSKPVVVITRGIALDCEGNEVIVHNNYTIDLSDSIEQFNRTATLMDLSQGNCTIDIGIVYSECQSNPATQYVTTCTSDAETMEYSRLKEGFRVVVRVEYTGISQSDLQCMINNRCGSSVEDYSGFSDTMIIWLARIILRKPAIEKINPCWIQDIRSHVIINEWEASRNKLLGSGIEIDHDISVIIYKKVDDAKKILENMNIRVSRDVLKLPLPKELRKKIREASPIVKEGSEITIITDETGEIVLFGLTNFAVNE